MEREFDRYAVIKWSDAQKCLTPEELKQLVALGVKFQQYRRDTQRRWECVVIEHDWPEYEPVWRMMEGRVDQAPVYEYMLVMQVTPIDGRAYKHRRFISVVQPGMVCRDLIMHFENDEAKKLGVKPSEVLTTNIVALN